MNTHGRTPLGTIAFPIPVPAATRLVSYENPATPTVVLGGSPPQPPTSDQAVMTILTPHPPSRSLSRPRRTGMTDRSDNSVAHRLSTSAKPAASAWHVLLASRSPRRQQMLRDAGLSFTAAHPGFEDAGLRPGGVDPARWTASLAYLKAATALRLNAFGGHAFTPFDIVVGADTAIVKGDRLIGTPESADEARDILRALRNGSHTVVSGLALLHPLSGRRELLWDAAEVHVGDLSDRAIDDYAQTGHWRGKAGGYNLRERIDDRWPIRHTGEPTTIMGLPMPRLLERLSVWESRARLAG